MTTDSSRLERQDWVNAALEVLKNEGIDRVKVDPIAKRLNVTRGSFYWHFGKRQDLLDAVLEQWKSVATEGVIEQVEAEEQDAGKKLRSLMVFSLSFDEEHFKLERALRAWAQTDMSARNAVSLIDQRRMDYLRSLLVETGYEPDMAEKHARLLYYYRTGLYHMAEIPTEADRLQAVDYLLALLN